MPATSWRQFTAFAFTALVTMVAAIWAVSVVITGPINQRLDKLDTVPVDIALLKKDMEALLSAQGISPTEEVADATTTGENTSSNHRY